MIEVSDRLSELQMLFGKVFCYAVTANEGNSDETEEDDLDAGIHSIKITRVGVLQNRRC